MLSCPFSPGTPRPVIQCLPRHDNPGIPSSKVRRIPEARRDYGSDETIRRALRRINTGGQRHSGIELRSYWGPPHTDVRSWRTGPARRAAYGTPSRTDGVLHHRQQVCTTAGRGGWRTPAPPAATTAGTALEATMPERPSYTTIIGNNTPRPEPHSNILNGSTRYTGLEKRQPHNRRPPADPAVRPHTSPL